MLFFWIHNKTNNPRIALKKPFSEVYQRIVIRLNPKTASFDSIFLLLFILLYLPFSKQIWCHIQRFPFFLSNCNMQFQIKSVKSFSFFLVNSATLGYILGWFFRLKYYLLGNVHYWRPSFFGHFLPTYLHTLSYSITFDFGGLSWTLLPTLMCH